MERNFLLLIIFVSFTFGGEQFSFFVKFASKNHNLVYEEFFISPVMVKKDIKYKTSFKILDPKAKNETTYEFLLRNKEILFDNFVSAKTKVYDEYIQEYCLGQSLTHVSILPINFAVEFKGDFAIIKSP